VTGYPRYPLARPSIEGTAARRASLVTPPFQSSPHHAGSFQPVSDGPRLFRRSLGKVDPNGDEGAPGIGETFAAGSVASGAFGIGVSAGIGVGAASPWADVASGRLDFPNTCTLGCWRAISRP